ncbi:MAG: F0F1 ATP synthase subunit A [Chloroflexi bacterium]|nr:F0F1 ATP synthase subunit A [Chloroflexota bacterium]
MPSRKLTIVLGVVILAAVGFIFFRAPLGHVQLPAEKIFTLSGFPITNTIIAAWASIIVLLAISYFGTRRMQAIPTNLQNFVELVVEMFVGMVESIAGKKNGRRFFPVVMTIFLFVVVSNWMGLLPGYGTIGFVEPDEHGNVFNKVEVGGLELALLMPGEGGGKEAEGKDSKHVEKGLLMPFLRSANTDVNTPLALALVSAFFVEYWGISTLGFLRYASKFFSVGKLLRGDLFIGFIDFIVGILELVSEFVRIVSFTFRLFGNILAGEILLTVLVFLVPWVAVIPFYGLELFVGLVQALIFAILTLIFGTVAVTAPGGEGHEKEHP